MTDYKVGDIVKTDLGIFIISYVDGITYAFEDNNRKYYVSHDFIQYKYTNIFEEEE